MIKRFSIIISLFISIPLLAQVNNNNWIAHYAFNEILSIQKVEKKIYATTINAILIHDINSGTNETITTIDGLSGDLITDFFVLPEEQLIFIGYETGLIELFDLSSKEIKSFTDIVIQTDLPSDSFRINSFLKENDTIFIATDFGIVTFSLRTRRFVDTIKFPTDILRNFFNVKDISIVDNSVYAILWNEDSAIYEVRQAGINSNLTFNSNWTVIQSNKKFSKFIKTENNLHALLNNSFYTLNGSNSSESFKVNRTFSNNIKGIVFSKIDQIVSVATDEEILELDLNLKTIRNLPIADELKTKINFAVLEGSKLFFSEDSTGLKKASTSNFTSIESLTPSSPSDNAAEKIEFTNSGLWCVYGNTTNDYSVTRLFTNIPPNIYNGNNWKTLDKEPFEGNYLTGIAQHPTKNNSILLFGYLSDKAIMEVTPEGEVLNSFDSENSNLEKSTIIGTSALSGAFNSNNELWIYNSENIKYLKKFSPNINDTALDEFHIDFTRINLGQPNPNDFLRGKGVIFDNNDNVFIGNRYAGVVGFNPSTKAKKNIRIADEENTVFSDILGLVIDANNDLWVGFKEGIRIFKNIENFFTPEGGIPENIIIEESGIFREFLSGVQVTDIEVDASNNKWIATDGAGVYFVSPNGQETFNIFRKSNSPLPSDTIKDIAISPNNGSVFIATDKGLVEFSGAAPINAEADFSKFKIFPNPVRPEYGDVNVQIQGLTAGAVVKITDIVGNLVYEIENPVINGSGSGAVTWDTRSFSGRKVASGVYLTLITSKDGEQTKIGKLLIIR